MAVSAEILVVDGVEVSAKVDSVEEFAEVSEQAGNTTRKISTHAGTAKTKREKKVSPMLFDATLSPPATPTKTTSNDESPQQTVGKCRLPVGSVGSDAGTDEELQACDADQGMVVVQVFECLGTHSCVVGHHLRSCGHR